MAAPPRKLGKGLGALLPGAGRFAPSPASSASSVEEAAFSHPGAIGAAEAGAGALRPGLIRTGTPIQVPLEHIKPNPKQPRRNFEPAALQELADSIREQGVLQPILIRTLLDGGYELIAGERRLRASQLAGLDTIPAVLTALPDEKLLAAALVENLQREDLNPIEVAEGFRALVEDLGITHDEAARQVGVSRASVSNALRILTLPMEVQQWIAGGELSTGHAKVLLSLSTALEQLELARSIVEASLSVREAEKLVKKPKARRDRTVKAKEKKASQEAIVRDFEEKLRNRFGTKVKIEDKGGKGEVRIEYYSNADFGRILSILGISVD